MFNPPLRFIWLAVCGFLLVCFALVIASILIVGIDQFMAV